MNVRRTSFMRIRGDKALLCNPKTGVSLVVGDCNEFLQPLVDGVTIDECASNIASKYNVEIEACIKDVCEFYIGLSNEGLVELTDNGWVRRPNISSSTMEIDSNSEDVEFTNTPVSEFYHGGWALHELHVDLTDVCTERCVHCYVPQNQHDYLPYAICEKVLREFREQQGLTVQLTGGECMMHPDFAKICRLCRELDLNFIVMSNLTLCDEKIVALLKETDPQFVNVSLYSMDEKEHDAVTQVLGSWRKTRAAIDALQEAGVAVRLATPLLKANQKAYPALKAFADERRVHLVPDCDIIPRCGGDCSNLNYACTPEEVEAVLAGDKAFWDRGYGKNPNIKPEDKICDIGKLLSINSKGLYYPCSGMHEYVLGDARQVTLTDVWKGEKMNYLRGLKNRDFPQCVGCEHRAFCKVCPAFNFNATGSLFKTIPAKCAVSAVKHKVYGGH